MHWHSALVCYTERCAVDGSLAQCDQPVTYADGLQLVAAAGARVFVYDLGGTPVYALKGHLVWRFLHNALRSRPALSCDHLVLLTYQEPIDHRYLSLLSW